HPLKGCRPARPEARGCGRAGPAVRCAISRAVRKRSRHDSLRPMAAEHRLADVFSHIDAQRERFVARLIDYVRHPSISAQNIGITDVAEILVGMLTGLGLDTRLVPTAGHPMVVARW